MAKFFWAIFLLATGAVSAYDAASPSPAPLPSVDCSDVVMDMMNCLDYITEGSNVTAPTAECCKDLKSVVQKSPVCLCEGLKMAPDFGVNLNVTRALGLPKACMVMVPNLGSCGVSPPSSSPAPPNPFPSPPEPSPAPPVSPSSPSEPSPAPVPVSPPPTSEPSPVPPVSPPTPSEPYPAPPLSPPPSTPKVPDPVEPPFDSFVAPSPAPLSSGSWELSSSLTVLLVGVSAVATLSYLEV